MEFFRAVPLIVWFGIIFVVSAVRTYATLKTRLARGETGDWRQSKDPEWFWVEALTDVFALLISGGFVLFNLRDDM